MMRLKDLVLKVLIITGMQLAFIQSIKAGTIDPVPNQDKFDYYLSNLFDSANIAAKNEDFLLSLQYLYRCNALAMNNQRFEWVVLNGITIANTFTRLKNYDLSLKYLKTSEAYLPKVNNNILLAKVYLSYAMYYYSKKEYDSAQNILFAHYNHVVAGPVNLTVGNYYKILGDVFAEKGELDYAICYYRKGLEIYLELKYKESSSMYTRIANMYYRKKHYRIQLYYNYKALSIRKEANEAALISSSHCNVGDSYLLLKDYKLAGVYFDSCLIYALKSKESNFIANAYRSLKELSIVEERYKDAIFYHQQFYYYRQQYSLKKSRSEIRVREASNEISEKEKLNEQLRKKILIQDLTIRKGKLQLLGIEVVFLSILSLIFVTEYFIRSNRKRKEDLDLLNRHLEMVISENREATIKLIRNEERHRFITENIMEVVSLVTVTGVRSYVSGYCQKMFGYTVDEMLSLPDPFALVDPVSQPRIWEQFQQATQSGIMVNLGYQAIHKSGNKLWIDATLTPVVDESSSTLQQIILVERDFSQRKSFEEEISESDRQKDFLLKEIHNRVKNNFAILGSLLEMIQNEQKNEELNVSFSELNLRIRTMALVHEQLYNAKEFNKVHFDHYLLQLCSAIHNSYRNKEINIQVDSTPLVLSIDLALPLGLIVNELLTNALKYAFPGDRKGRIKVSLTPVDDGSSRLSVCDNGIGLPPTFDITDPPSMGTRIVSILVRQVEGALEVVNDHGACFHLTFTNKS